LPLFEGHKAHLQSAALPWCVPTPQESPTFAGWMVGSGMLF